LNSFIGKTGNPPGTKHNCIYISAMAAAQASSSVQKNVQDNAVAYRDKRIVAAGSHPVIATWRRAEVMTAPIANYIAPAAILTGKACSAMEIMLRACAAHLIITMIGLFMSSVGVRIAPVIVMMIIASGESRPRHRHAYRYGCRNNCFIVHVCSLLWLG
jgi:hypothetical protein